MSLVCLYFGKLAIRKDSGKLALISGLFFSAALLTKLYSVFMLVPLLILYIYHRPKKPKQILGQLAAFSIPAIYTSILWYQLILKEDLVAYIIHHNDFKDLNSPAIIPTYSFISNFLVNYGLGFFFVAATAFSLIIGILFRKHFPKQLLVFDFVCLVTLLSILGINMYLGVGINLKAPYTSAIKFSYQSLPFFSLAAASLASKCVLLLNWAKHTVKLKNALTGVVGFVGVFLLVTPLLINMNSAHQLSMTSFLIFKVQAGQSVGYSFDVFSPITQGSPLMTVQYLGFAFILSGSCGRASVLCSPCLDRCVARSKRKKLSIKQDKNYQALD